MASRWDLEDWIVQALRESGGRASVVDVARHIWAQHGNELRRSGDLFYTWQYDMRWAAYRLRRRRVVRSTSSSPRGNGSWLAAKLKTRDSGGASGS